MTAGNRSFSDVRDALVFNSDAIDTNRALWFCADILDVDAVGENAVCLGMGADFEAFRGCGTFFRSFPAVFLAIAAEEVRAALADALQEYVPGIRLLLPRADAFGTRRNVREVLAAGGREAVDRLLVGAVEPPMPGLLDIAAVEDLDPSSVPSILSGIGTLDRLTGGFYPGELSVWTGKRGGGKSTLLGQLLIEAVDQGHKVFAYSGELPAWRFRNWVYLQAAGPEHVQLQTDPLSGKETYVVPPMVKRRLDAWFKGKFFLYDNTAAGGNNEDAILSVMAYAVRRHGCAVFLIDNLMTARFEASSDRDFWRAQSNFTGRLVEFAKANGVHVHLVAHPRKAEGGKVADADDVAGSGDITNRADNAFSLQRLSDDECVRQGCQSVLRILKNRAFGASGAIGLNYDESSRRFYRAAGGTPGKRFGWDAGASQAVIPLPERDGGPF